MRRALTMLGLVLCAAVVRSEEPVGTGYGESIEVRVVEVEVTVRDRDGRPVTGLGPDDFRLLVDGREVAIDAFTELRPSSAEPSSAEDEPRRRGDSELRPAEAAAVHVLVYIDEEFSLALDLDRVLGALERQLVELRPIDRVAIVAWDGREVARLLDWTAPGATVAAAIAAARERPAWGIRTRFDEAGWRADRLASYGVADRFDPCFDAAVYRGGLGRECSGPLSRLRTLEIAHRIDRTARAVAAAVQAFEPAAGRRILALLSGGWPNSVVDHGSPFAAWDPLLDVADQLRYSIYAVDVPGMSAFFLADVERGDAVSAGLPRTSNARESPVHQTLQYLAESTGGEALINADRRFVFARISAEARSYYALAFAAALDRDDASHRIRVEARPPGLDVRSRLAYRDLSRSTELDYALEAALLDDSPDPDRPALTASLGEAKRERIGRIVVPLRLTLPSSAAPAGLAAGALELRVAAVDDAGRRTLVGPLALPADARLGGPGDARTVEIPLRLRRSTADLAVSLHDPSTGEHRIANLRLSNSIRAKPGS